MSAHGRHMKEVEVTTLNKKGNKSDHSNYIPASLTSTCCKVKETIVGECIMEHVENLLTEYQHGFHQKMSCCTQLLKETG